MTLLGVVTVVFGFASLFARPPAAIFLFMFFSIANAAGTVSIGGSSIPPVNLFSLFFCLRALTLPHGITNSLGALSPRAPGFLLAVFICYAVLTAIFFPVILKGTTYILYADRSVPEAEGFFARPLTRGSGNINQTLYAIQGLAVFAVAHAYVRVISVDLLPRAFRFLALLNIAFAIADIVTYSSGTTFLMEPFRSGAYDIHVGQTAGGIRRIVGTFAEPSAFAGFSFSMLCGTFVLWQFGFGGRVTYLAMVANLILLVVSTSTTGYGALAVFAAIVVGWLIYALFTSGWTGVQQGVVFGIIGIVISILGMYAFNMIPETVLNIFSATLNKGQSESGIDRAAMNVRAWSNFTDTFGLGAGLGSARASSYVFVLLSNVGLVGTTLFLLFTSKLIAAKSTIVAKQNLVLALAKSQILASLICAVLSAGVFDLGASFYLWCGVASAVIGQVPRQRYRARQNRRASAYASST